MAYTRSFIIRKIGNSKAIYLPADWGIEKDEMVTVRAMVDGKEFVTTVKTHFKCSSYIYIPSFWPIAVGDIVEMKVTYANVPVNLNTRKRGKNLNCGDLQNAMSEDEEDSDADTRAED